MKKYLSVLAIILVISPSVALASWWNPFSWGIFHRENKTQILENRVKELEKKLELNASTTNKTYEEIIDEREAGAIEIRNNLSGTTTSKTYEQTIIDAQKKAAEIRAQLEVEQESKNAQKAEQEKLYQETLAEQQKKAAEIRAQLEVEQAVQAQQNSAQCLDLKNQLTNITNQYNNVWNSYKLAPTGSAVSSDYLSQSLNLSIQMSDLQSKVYAVCDNFYGSPQKTYYTTCYSLSGYEVNCTTQ